MQVSQRTNPIRQQSSSHSASASKTDSRSVAGQKDSAGSSNATDDAQERQAMSGGSSFSDPMADADTLMRAIIANTPGKAEKKNDQTPAETKALNEITEQFQTRFAENASNKDEFHALMQKSFGDQYDQGKAEDIRQQTLNGDFSWMPDVKLVNGSTLTDVSGQQTGGTGLGAYGKDNDTIYLSRDLLMSDPAKAEEILTEEVGHALDARINTSDAAGDEGDIFSKLSHGEELSASELADLRSENDSGTIMVDGREVEVEYGFFSKAWKGIKKVGKSVFKGVKNVGKALLKGDLKGAGKALVNGVKDVGKSIKESVSDAWKEIKKGFKKIMESELLGKIMMVAQFIPIPIVQVAVKVYNLAKAAYSVYQGVKHGSLAMVAGGIAGVAGGAAGLGKMAGATGKWVGQAANVAKIAKGVGAAHQAISTKNYAAGLQLAAGVFGVDTKVGGALQTLGQVEGVRQSVKNGDISGGIQGAIGIVGADTQVGGALQTLGKVEGFRQAVKDGNIFAAVSAGTNLAQDFTGDQGDAFLSTVDKHSNTIQQIDYARKTGDYAGAVNLLRTEFGDVLNLPQSAQDTLQRIEGGITYAQSIDQLINEKDYAGAIDMLRGGLASQVKDPETLAQIESFATTLGKIDSAATAVNDGRYADALGLGAEVIGHPLSDSTQLFVHSVENKAQVLESFVGAVKERDVNTSSALLRELLPDSLSDEQQDNIVDTFQHVGLTGVQLENLVAAIEANDYAAAAGGAADLSRHLAGGDNVLARSMDTFGGMLSTAENVETLLDDGDYKGAADALLDGVSAEVTNPATLARIESLSGAFNQIDTAATAVNEGRYADALELTADLVGQPLSPRVQQFVNSVEHKAQTLQGLVSAVEDRDVATSSAMLGDLLSNSGLSAATRGNTVGAFEYTGLAAVQIENLQSAIDNKQYAGAADIAADLSRHLAGGDNVLSDAMDKLSSLLSSKIEVRLDSLAGIFATPTLNEAIGGR